LGFNDDPPVPGRGSAIFLHRARDHFAPTEGCVALAPKALHIVVSSLEPDSHVTVRGVES
jgi:L,D-peptidoglycan transpeptidase YkuD (ErfK/YbiS/YcfS/YnhG family)